MFQNLASSVCKMVCKQGLDANNQILANVVDLPPLS